MSASVGLFSSGLARRLLRFLVILALGLTALNAWASYYLARGSLIDGARNQLESIADEKVAALNAWIDGNRRVVNAIASLVSSEGHKKGGPIDGWLENHRLPFSGQIDSLELLHPQTGEVLEATRSVDRGKFKNLHPYFEPGRNGVLVHGPYYSLSKQRAALVIAAPVFMGDSLHRLLVAQIRLEGLSDIAGRGARTDGSLHTYLINQANLFVTQPALAANSAILRRANFTEPVQACLAGHSGFAEAADYRKVSALAAHVWIPEHGLCLVTQRDRAEALGGLQLVALQFFVTGLAAVLLLVAFIAVYVPRNLHQIGRLVEATRQIRDGDLNMRLQERGDEELRELTANFNDMVEQLKERDAAVIQERDKLERARREAVSASEEKSIFLSKMSHELRTPLNAVIGLTDLTLDSQLTAEQRGYLSRVSLAGNTLLGIINDILDFSRIEAGELQIDARDFSLNEVLDATEAVVGPKARENGVALRMTLSEDVPVALNGDGMRLNQVLINLVGNAVKFTSQGRVELIIDRLVEDGLPDRLRLMVRDTGIGIPADQLDRLFMPFTQADQYITRRFGGTGLGLAICAQLVQAMKGEISVRSVPDEGSEFTVLLPLKPALAPLSPKEQKPETIAEAVRPQPVDISEPEDMPETADVRGLSDETGPRILLAEDNELNQILTVSVLERAGFLVDLAQNGREALELLTRGGRNHYLAVLMDVQMPVMDGLVATREIRWKPEFDDLPIVALTAHATTDQRQLCLDAGMNSHFTKPFRAEELIAHVRSLAAHRGVEIPFVEFKSHEEAPFREHEAWSPDKLPLPPDVVFPLVRRFLDRYGDAFVTLSTMIKEDLVEDALSYSHELRGVAGSLQGKAVIETLHSLEAALRERDDVTVKVHLKELEVILQALFDEMENALSET